MRTPAALYACLHAREFPLQAMLRVRPALRQKILAVLDGEPPFEQVCSINARARALGITRGMTQAEMEVFPDAVLLRRSLAEEAVAKTALLECASRFSPRVEDRSHGESFDESFTAVIDIAGTEKLFGAPLQLGTKLRKLAGTLGIQASVVISSNFHTAVCLARGKPSPPNVLIVPPGTELSALSPLGLQALGISPELSETFSSWGIATLGSLGDLPEKELIARLGQESKRLRQLARGELPHLFKPMEPDFILEEYLELDSPVEASESLLFALATMLEQLIARAKTNLLALASMTFHAALEGGASYTRTLKPALPSNDRKLWLKLLGLDLEAHPPGAPVMALRVSAQSGATGKCQLGLFCPQLPEPMRLDVTLARIRAIVGEDCAGQAVLQDTHRPDTFSLQRFVVQPTSAAGTKPMRKILEPRIALRQIRPPEEVAVRLRNHVPHTFIFRERLYAVERSYGPWHSGGDWWGSAVWSLVQWDLVARMQEQHLPDMAARLGGLDRPSGSSLCCCLTHDLIQNCWRMEALYD
jgi:protein ImuB